MVIPRNMCQTWSKYGFWRLDSYPFINGITHWMGTYSPALCRFVERSSKCDIFWVTHLISDDSRRVNSWDVTKQYWEIQTWRFFEVYHRVDGLKAFPLNFQAKPKMRSNPVSFEFAHRINRIDDFFHRCFSDWKTPGSAKSWVRFLICFFFRQESIQDIPIS
jgi:hypothetical protein